MPADKRHAHHPARERENGSPSEEHAVAIVGIGASAGGLEAATALLDALPPDTGLAFVLIQHLAPDHPSMLVDLLARHTDMPVEEAQNAVPAAPNHIYVIPPNASLGILHGVLQVLPALDHHGALLTIDYFLCALARDQGPRAIGVILSGSASDGARGIAAIKAESGITFAQNKESAQHPSMPQSAAEAGADKVLSPADIARELARIAGEPLRVDSADRPGLGDHLGTVLFLLRNQSGHDFTGYKPNTIERRITRRMLLHKLRTVEEYIRYLQQSPGELQALFEELLISVTAFFRDPEVFDALQRQVFPRLIEGRPAQDPIRVWVPGCAGGEEAYSIAIALSEYLASTPVPAQTVQVFGSDIDERAILRARAGLYPDSIMADVSAERLQRFFVKTTNGYQVAQPIRDMCVFAVQDINRDPPFSRMDLVSCRNLLIYLGPALQEKVLGTLHYALKPAGFLLLGSSESIGKAADLFTLMDKKAKIYERKSSQRPVARPGTSWPETRAGEAITRTAAPIGAPARDVVREAEQYILAEFSPPALIVNDHMEVVGYSGRTSPYIEPAHGAASAQLFKVVRQELTGALHLAVHQVLDTNEPVAREAIRYRAQEAERYVDLTVRPLPAVPGYVLVVFQEAGMAPASPPPESAGSLVRALEQELSTTRGQLQSIISEQVNTGETLQSAYEELLSSNEELQSTNEELESAKEELQSTNEELATVNEELLVRNGQLEHANDDLLNLLASVELPMVMLDGELRVRHFTPMARPLLNLIDADVGRPLRHLRTNLDIKELDRDLQAVVDSGDSRTIEVRGRGERWYSLRMRPYKSQEGAIEGAVLVFLDLAEFSAEHAQDLRLAAMVRESADAISLLDLDGRILEWNRGAEALYGYPQAEAQRMNVSALAPHPEQRQVQELLARLRAGETLRSVGARRVTRDGHELEVSITASPLPGPDGAPIAIVSIEQDITHLKHNLERAQRLATVVHDANDAITVRDLDGRIRVWNRAAERLYGYREEEMLGLGIDRLLSPAAREQDEALLTRLRRGEPNERFTTQRRTRNGGTITVELTASLLRDDEGRPQAITTTERTVAG
ncbi:chemotaxis protein CheB [Thiohalomonas denitrificans]|uniref:protein-glutamate O-methyltransferase n=1 Tax=Thiohalomonas denitrificans TaxID=415747 RepID=A0A1G5Q6I3_9GAMM|nr:chemotaxis protein CheB [Thiohalomonas denitrificans]SCZ57453.1 two-component system, chemotaxis family, CheB/CheR fusion protein [Thiohalomonas denitrificans]